MAHKTRLALALAMLLSAFGAPAFAADCIYGTGAGNSRQCYQTYVPVDPATGNPTTPGTARSTAAYQGGTIAVGGTAQPWLAANPSRRGFTIQNQSTGDLYIKIGGTAAANNTSLKIAAGQLYESSSIHVSTAAISIIGATTGQAWYGTEF